jgi:hypothetical protein
VRHSLRITVLLLAAGLVVLAAGCGGGSKSSAPPTTTTQQETTNMTTTGNGGPDFASAQNCAQLAGLAAQVASAVSTNSGDTASMLRTESQDIQALANAAPAEIKGDFQTFATAFSSYLQAIQNSGYTLGSTTPPSAAQLAAIENAVKVFDTKKLKQAEQHLNSWVHANCK